MVLPLVKNLLEFAIAESLMKVMTVPSAKQAITKILKLDFVNRAQSVKNKEVMKIVKDMELVINTVNKQSAHVIQALLMMALTSVQNVKTHYSHSLTARRDNGCSVSLTSTVKIWSIICQEQCSTIHLKQKMKKTRSNQFKDLME
jgi:hypothetical protein